MRSVDFMAEAFKRFPVSIFCSPRNSPHKSGDTERLGNVLGYGTHSIPPQEFQYISAKFATQLENCAF